MAFRPFLREQAWLLPPSLDELVSSDHPARFVAAFVDGLAADAWAEMKVSLEPEGVGAPPYHPRALLCIWVYGFMTGLRSARKLEAACREQLPYLWLTGCQYPDHNTLWRFYRDNREGMRRLLKRTVRTAVKLGLVDLAVQAVDGSKILANAARDRTLDQKGLARLLQRTEVAIGELESQNGGGGASSPRLTEQLSSAKELRERVRRALAEVEAEEGPKRVNLSDADVQLLKGRQGIVAAYNAQAVVSAVKEVAGRRGLFITAAEVTNSPDDHAQLVPMLEAAEEMTGRAAEGTLADGGYHSGANLEACERRGSRVLMPESQGKGLEGPYHKHQFQYDAATDSYICPQGERLRFRGMVARKGEPGDRRYRVGAATCRACPAFGRCTKDKRQGRALDIGPYEDLLERHRQLMATDEAQALYKQRKELVEPVFGIMKEQQGARRFLLRGLRLVRCEWALLAAAFNLRTLYAIWRQWLPARRGELTRAVS